MGLIRAEQARPLTAWACPARLRRLAMANELAKKRAALVARRAALTRRIKRMALEIAELELELRERTTNATATF